MENQVIEKIIEKLNIEQQILAQWHEFGNLDNRLDGELELNLKEKNLKFDVEFKREIVKHHLLQIFLLIENYPNLMVIADIINPKIRQELKDKGVNYIDGAGNMYINREGQLIFIEGKHNERAKDYYKGRLFGKGGLKIIFALLVNEDLLNKPYRDIAEEAGTALGTVNYIFMELMTNKYIISLNEKKLKLNNKKDLMNKWIAGYEDKLKKTLWIGKFRFNNNNEWKNIIFENNKTLWGGEPAADILTHYLLPQIFTIYTKDETKELIKKYYLIPDANGVIDVYKKFWNFDYDAIDKNVVPPLLIYADLINTGDDRNLEAAKLIYERYLQDKFE